VQAAGVGVSKDIPVDGGLDGLVRDSLAVVDALFGPKQAVAFVGHSMGGVVGIRLACQHPARVTHLVLVAPAPSQGITVPSLLPSMAAERALAQRGKEYMRARAQTQLALAPRLQEAAGSSLEAEAAVLGRQLRKLEKSLTAREDHFSGLWRDMEAAREDLSLVRAPTLVVVGAADDLLAVNLQDYQRLRRTATLHVFSRVGHDVPREVPGALAEVVVDFLTHGVVTWRQTLEAAARVGALANCAASLGTLSAMYERPAAGQASDKWRFRGPAAERRAVEKGKDANSRACTTGAGVGAAVAAAFVLSGCGFYERPEAGVASQPWTYRGPAAEAASKRWSRARL
jgi:pimeloyl-ACP methyl ester carboxylesterase